MHSTPRVRHHVSPWYAVGAAMVAAALLTPSWRWLQRAENDVLDFAFQARASAAVDSSAVLIGIADSSFTITERAPQEVARNATLAELGGSWPWNRRVFAETVRRLRAAGARAIVFDVVFEAVNAGDPEFARVLAEPGAPVVLASLWQENRSAEGEVVVRFVEPQPTLLEGSRTAVGYANVWADDDGVVRTLTIGRRASDFVGGEADPNEPIHPSLAVAAAQALGVAAAETPRYLDFRHQPGSTPLIPIEDLFLADRWNGRLLDGGRLFADRVVWIGPTSEIRFKDYLPTPLGRIPGVEIQSRAVSALVDGLALHPITPTLARACLWVLAAGGVLVTVLCRRVALQVTLLTVGIFAWAGVAFASVALGWAVLPVIGPLGAWTIGGAAGVSAHFMTEQRERRRLRAVLGRYVSEEVAQVIADQPGQFSDSMRGRRLPVTVLFADLRGFTSWVERAEPEIFVAQLNEYFREIVDCVLANGGTLQKFIGDAVLAVWGDTRTAGATADAARAVDAALAMQAAVLRLNADWTGRADRAQMTIGIGLHHGEAIVGNVGHPRRMEFTVLGDVVNTASRLESATKQFGTSLLVSGTVRQLTVETHHHVPLGQVALKGKREPVAIFTAIGRRSAAAPEWLAEAGAAEASLRLAEFDAAAQSYGALATRVPSLADCFRRLAAFSSRQNLERPADWTGVRVLDEK